MARIVPAEHIFEIHGKLSGKSSGYFYLSKQTGKTYYREREEGYQKNQSPRQKWNSAAFAYAFEKDGICSAWLECLLCEQEVVTSNQLPYP